MPVEFWLLITKRG